MSASRDCLIAACTRGGSGVISAVRLRRQTGAVNSQTSSGQIQGLANTTRIRCGGKPPRERQQGQQGDTDHHQQQTREKEGPYGGSRPLRVAQTR